VSSPDPAIAASFARGEHVGDKVTLRTSGELSG
jgi:hypothetical protein